MQGMQSIDIVLIAKSKLLCFDFLIDNKTMKGIKHQ